MTTQEILQGVHDWTNGKIVYDISAAHPDGQGNPTPYADLTAALGTGGVNIPEDIRKGGMSIKFIQGTINYTVVKTEGVTEVPTGTEIQNDPSIESGTYKANQLSAFSALPTTPNSSLTYYLAVTETVDEQEVTTYTTWVITYVQSSDNKYVQYRLTATSFSVIESDWQGVDTESKDLLNKDFAIEDENHKAIAIFSEGHIRTKNFDSKVEKQRVTDGFNIRPVIGNFAYDFAIEDELQEKAIVLFSEGHIRTKNFDSKKVLDKLLNVEAFVLTHPSNINQTAIPCGLSKLAKIIRNENAVFNLGMIGDSWTQGVGNESMNRITYVKFLTRLLWDKYGYAGLGWFDFGYSNSDMKCADDSCISLSKSLGDITYVTRTPSSLGIARSHAVFASGAYYNLTLVNNETPIDKAVIWFYNNAAFTYEINDSGIQVQVTADASSGWQSVTITENITKIKITATANNTIIFGIDFSYGNKGVKVHKLGNRAATSTDFVEGNADEWIEGISKLNIDTLTELLFTNDRWIDNTAPSVVINNINTLFSRFKQAHPLSDVVCIAPSDNYESGVHPYTTEQYAQAVYLYCVSNNIPFVSLIPLFGTKNQVQNLGLFFDNLHPNFDGANLIGNFLFKELFNIKF